MMTARSATAFGPRLAAPAKPISEPAGRVRINPGCSQRVFLARELPPWHEEVKLPCGRAGFVLCPPTRRFEPCLVA